MNKFTIALLVALAGCASTPATPPAPVVKVVGTLNNENYTVTLTDAPCTNVKILAMVNEDRLNEVNKTRAGKVDLKNPRAVAYFGKNQLEICYVIEGDVVYAGDEAGNAVTLDKGRFQFNQ